MSKKLEVIRRMYPSFKRPKNLPEVVRADEKPASKRLNRTEIQDPSEVSEKYPDARYPRNW